MALGDPRKKALFVGISYKGQQGPGGFPAKDFELKGAHGDVEKVRNLLTSQYGYLTENINILQDSDGYVSPTRRNIVDAMEDLVKNATPGDSLFFFFAGHGDQITNLDGTERDQKDEIILPLDWKVDETLPLEHRDRYTVKIIDDEMNDILVKRLPHNCRLTALFDACHSGTLLDLPFIRYCGPPDSPSSERHYMTTAPRSSSPEPCSPDTACSFCRLRGPNLPCRDSPRPRQKSLQVFRRSSYFSYVNRTIARGPLALSALPLIRGRSGTGKHWRSGTWNLRGESQEDPDFQASPYAGADIVSWSACSDAQNGYEIEQKDKPNKSGGFMVQAFVALLSEEPYRTYGDILEGLGEKLRASCVERNKRFCRSEWVMQEPQLGSHYPFDLDKIFSP